MYDGYINALLIAMLVLIYQEISSQISGKYLCVLLILSIRGSILFFR